MKKILIAGGLGYLGGRMAKYFSDKGYTVIITTRKLENKFPNNIEDLKDELRGDAYWLETFLG